MRNVMSGLFGFGKTKGSKLGLLQYHPDTSYQHRLAISKRLKSGDIGGTTFLSGVELPPEIKTNKKPMAVLRFEGSIRAAGRKGFAKLVDEVIVNKSKFSACAAIISSPGGTVTGYGHMYMQMKRLRDAGIFLIALIDEYAASGGYLMSLPANIIVAPPLSVLGSIGVACEFLNFHEFLKSFGVRPMTLTAGKFKRTLSLTGEVTTEAEEKVKAELAVMHRQFIDLVKQWRPQIDTEQVCTGEHWSAQEAYDRGLGLVDQIECAEAFLLAINQDRDLIELSTKENPLQKGLLGLITSSIDHIAAELHK